MYKMYEVFKHPSPWKGKRWAVKLPHGIECFTTKAKAEAFAEAAQNAFSGALPDTRILRIAAGLLPIIDELTTSDLQGCVAADVSRLALPKDEAARLEDDVLEYIYSAQRGEVAR
jgi:hypothetical protein